MKDESKQPEGSVSLGFVLHSSFILEEHAVSTSTPSDGQSSSPEQAPPVSDFPVVGVGASAGGLEAFTELLENLPADPGLALLFVQHLDPHHKSQLPEILGRVTRLKVSEATHGMPLEKDHLYLIPPNTLMTLNDGRLTLSPRAPAPGHNMPIDHLFRSLAAVHKSRAIGVLLSGGGTDGTLGFHAIKAEGGITIAQEESSARHVSMPRSAILDGYVDFVLPPRDIAHELVRLTQHPYAREAPLPADPLHVASSDAIGEALNLLRSGTGVDFTHYKRTTIKRRILRRMALRAIERVEDYLHLLRENSTEVNALYQDFLIHVTQFFRDPEVFDALQDRVFPVLIDTRPPESPLRVWVAGCASGEEVYSLAICLLEYMESRGKSVPVKILATDLSEDALNKARAGVYLDNIEIDVSPEHLRRFFVRVNHHYQICKAVRDLCVFSQHNLASDPPYGHLDLVSCRNVLIYMDTALQRRVLPVLHYALQPSGILLLGSSESVGAMGDLFAVVDAKSRIYSKKPGTTAHLDFSAFAAAEGRRGAGAREEGGQAWSALEVQKEADRLVLARYAPVGVLVDESMTVLQFRGRTAPFLEPAPGMASLDLFRMLREGLLAEVRAAVNQARAENVFVSRSGLRLTEGGQARQVRVEVIPFKVSPASLRFFLVLFQDVAAVEGAPVGAPPAAAPAAGQAAVAPPEAANHQLQQEMAALREYLQSVIEEQESTNEELKSANEEILSANEELQSTNEELQTAKEEAQSANEELATVNEELRHRNAELARVNNDLVNVLSGMNIPIVMVGRDLRIRRFTPLAEQLFNLIPTDAGRPISDIHSNLDLPDLPQRIGAVIDTLTPHEAEVQDKRGRWYALRIRPYVTLDGKIDGASVVLLDIDRLKSGPQPQQRMKDEG
jgi:two-component system CheB/CheR fusion protein